MAKETMIIFVYDTECCQDEADDPVDAVLYFHPSWVSDTQKLSLCGQLMGVTHFLNECFYKPKIISLKNGKFILREFGRFILAVGTDRNLSDALLEHRANLLTSLLKFSHHDIQTIYDQFLSINGGQYKNLSDKLYQIFETYLPILQYNGNIFQNILKLRLPKSGSNIFLDAIQTLQSCQQTKGILGGTILYHNKVVATQLSSDITKNLVLIDPFHIKSTAEPIIVDFHVPIGVQLLIVYISVSDYQKLQKTSQKLQNITTTTSSSSSSSQYFSSSNNNSQPPTPLPTLLPFQFHQKQRNKMKRDKSLIFTNIPEEGHEMKTTEITSDLKKEEESQQQQQQQQQPQQQLQEKKTNVSRPNHLPLKFKNVTSKEIPESGFVSINFDESDNYPEFTGRTSVCSTPMTENKILQYDNIMSICANNDPNFIINDKLLSKKQNLIPSSTNNVIKCKNDESKKSNNSLLKIDFDKFFTNFINNPHKKLNRHNSISDLQDAIKTFSKRLTTSIKSTKNQPEEQITNDFLHAKFYIEDITNTKNLTNKKKLTSFRTITDPMYPMFNSEGEPISKSLFQDFLDKHYKTLTDSQDKNNIDKDKILKIEELNIGGTDDDNKLTKKLIEEFKEFENELNKAVNNSNNDCGKQQINKNDEKLSIKSSTIQNRKSLSLPLKPLNDLTNDETSNGNGVINGNSSVGGIFERKKHSGIQLTPLMAKLSILALNEERSSSFCSWDTTPGMELATPIDCNSKLLRRKSSSRNNDIIAVNDNTDEIAVANGNQFKKVELYVCGQQNMVMLLLMEEGSAQKQDIVQSMFDICVSKLIKIETQLNQTLNVNVDGDKNEGGYSYIYIDPEWDTIQRGGPWSITDLDSLEHMHKNLNLEQSNLADMILRTNECVLYGYKCGSKELFYKQPAHSQNGLPPPADIMGTISIKAKRRLERDHSIVLF